MLVCVQAGIQGQAQHYLSLFSVSGGPRFLWGGAVAGTARARRLPCSWLYHRRVAATAAALVSRRLLQMLVLLLLLVLLLIHPLRELME